MNDMYYGYAVVEYERGWGSRPDGYVVTIDEKRKEFEKVINNNPIIYDYNDGEVYSKVETLKLCILELKEGLDKDAVKTAINKNSYVWLDKKDVKVISYMQ